MLSCAESRATAACRAHSIAIWKRSRFARRQFPTFHCSITTTGCGYPETAAVFGAKDRRQSPTRADCLLPIGSCFLVYGQKAGCPLAVPFSPSDGALPPKLHLIGARSRAKQAPKVQGEPFGARQKLPIPILGDGRGAENVVLNLDIGTGPGVVPRVTSWTAETGSLGSKPALRAWGRGGRYCARCSFIW